MDVNLTELVDHVYNKYKEVGTNTPEDLTEFIRVLAYGLQNRFFNEPIEKHINSLKTKLN